jgi:hypothetical protein
VGQSRSSSDEPAPSALELVVVAGDAIRLTTLPACGAVTLGRGEECEVRIDNRSVSRRHAVLHLGPPLRLQDLGSANGTFVHDTRTPRDTASTHPLRKLSKETIEIEIGARVSLGSIPIVIRRAAAERQPHAAPDHIVVRDPGMRVLYEQLTRVARSTISVLVLGETGVGKEVLARAVHRCERSGARARGKDGGEKPGPKSRSRDGGERTCGQTTDARAGLGAPEDRGSPGAVRGEPDTRGEATRDIAPNAWSIDSTSTGSLGHAPILEGSPDAGAHGSASLRYVAFTATPPLSIAIGAPRPAHPGPTQARGGHTAGRKVSAAHLGPG